MTQHINALWRVAADLEKIDPIIAYEFSRSLRTAISTDRWFVLEMNPISKKLSHPSDAIELSENRAGGWDWTHTNVDGQGSRDTTGWRLQPSEVLKMIDSEIQGGPAVEEIKKMLSDEMASGNAGVPRGAEMGGGPSAIDPPAAGEGGGVSAPLPKYESIWDVASVKRIKKAIHTAYSRPSTRPVILPILRKVLKLT